MAVRGDLVQPRPTPWLPADGRLVIGLFLVLLIWPLVLFRDPAMQDYSNHLARAFIITHPDLFRQGYAVNWAPIPDLGWDLWAAFWSKWLPLHAAATLFFVFYFVLALSGLFALNRAFNELLRPTHAPERATGTSPFWRFAPKGRQVPTKPHDPSSVREPVMGNGLSLTPLLAAPFLLNGGYTKGFFNFDLGLALMLWALAAWLWLGPERWRLRLLAGTAFSTLLYFVHFYTFAVYGLFLLGLELPPRLRQGPRGILYLARDGLQAAPALACLIFCGDHLKPPPTAYIQPWHRLIDLGLLIDTNHVWLNIVLVVAMLSAIGFALARKWLRLPASLILPLILAALVFVAIPDSIFGTAYVAWRTLLAAALVGIAALRPAPGSRAVTPLLVLALTAVLLNSALFAVNAARTAHEKRAFLTAIAPMPYGARLFWAHAGGTQHGLIANCAGAYHIGSEAVIARHAVVQSMFAYQGQQILAFRDRRVAVPGNSQTFLTVIARDFHARGQDLGAYVRMFDYVLLEGPGDPKAEAQLPKANLIPVTMAGDFRLYAVRRQPARAILGPPDE